MARLRIGLVLALATPLAACAGGSGDTLVASGGSIPTGGGGAPGAPAPGAPAPSAPLRYLTFDQLTGDQTFETSFASGETAGAPFYQGASSVGGTIAYSAATNTYTVDYYGFPLETYKPGRDNLAGTTFNFEKISDELLYTRVASWSQDRVNDREVHRGAFGVSTRRGDVPPGGTASYRQLGFFGNAVRREGGSVTSYDLANSTFDLSVDFNAGTFDAKLALVGTRAGGGANVDLGTYTINPGSGRASTFGFGGTWRQAGVESYVGFFSGEFFGPQAAEYGMSFSINNPDNTPTLNAHGVVVGKKR